MSDKGNGGNAWPRKATVWIIVGLVVTVAVVIGLYGGMMLDSLSGPLIGQQQEPGLDDPGSIEQRADQLVGETVPSPPIADTTPVAGEPVPPDEPVNEVAVPTDQRQLERRTLAYESPLTPPVTDIASRIQQRRVSPPLQRDQEEQVAAETARANNSNGAPAGVLTDAAFSPQAAVATRTPADVPRHELYRGSVIAAVLESAIDSDLPGLVRARTTRDVYDSRTGTHVLIPRGSRLIGVYGQNNGGGPGAGANRRRLFVAWEELRLPDGTPVALDNFSALGADGASGIKARRATGFLEALGAAVVFDLAGNATAILTAATGIGRQQSETGALANAISGALGNSTQRVGADYVGSLLAQGPRFRVKAGSFMNVIVEQDLMLPAAGGATDRRITTRAPGSISSTGDVAQ